MSDKRSIPIGDLIDYELGLLDEGRRVEVAAWIQRDANDATRLDRIRRTLAPLSAFESPEPPVDLVDRIMVRVLTTTPLEYVASSSSMPPEQPRMVTRRPFFSIGEMIAMAACILLLFSVLVPGVSTVRSRQMQAMCGSNLASLFRGAQMYAAAHDGFLPNAGVANANWLQQPNRTHMMPGLQLRFITPGSLVCPTTPLTGMPANADEKSMQDFIQRLNLRFYSTQSQHGPVVRMSAQLVMPIAGDANPVFEDGVVQQPNWQANSRAHAGKGQNVLMTDGSVQFLPRPLFGPRPDNIWKVDDVDQYSGTESQRMATDAFLLP